MLLSAQFLLEEIPELPESSESPSSSALPSQENKFLTCFEFRALAFPQSI
jgi:hypothetical protein